MIAEAIVASVIAGSSVCSDHFDNVSRYNPTDLSDYQKCVLTVHNDDSAGTLGSIFWVKVGDDFVSMPVKKLQMAGSESKAKMMVMDSAVNKLTEDHIEAINFFDELTGYGLDEAAVVLAVNDKFGLDIIINEAAGVTVTGPDGISITRGGNLNYTVDFADGYGLIPTARGHDNIDEDGNFIGTVPAQTLTNSGNTLMTNYIYEDGTWRWDEQMVQVGSDRTPVTNDSGDTIRLTFIPGVDPLGNPQTLWIVENALLSDVIESVYDEGYQDGYDDGYSAGYKQGFSDGVASVR